jgi:hypothetical protein
MNPDVVHTSLFQQIKSSFGFHPIKLQADDLDRLAVLLDLT